MQRAITLAGFGQTAFGEWWEKSLRDLMEEAVSEAFKNAAVSPLSIDCVIVANMLGERVSGQAHLGALASSLLPHRPPALRTEAACASGGVALATAVSLLESGRAENVLVIGVEKMTDATNEEIASALMGAADVEEDLPSGLTFPGIFGLIARRYMYEYGLSREDLSLVSARHHEHALSNIFAQFRMAITPESVEQSPSVADPLCMLDCSPISDGAAACILSSTEKGPLRIAASAFASDTLSITDRMTLTSFSASDEASRRAYREADVSAGDIAHLETHDCFSIAALINLEDLGFAERGRGIDFYRTPHPSCTVNLSGGLKACGHPVAATGVKQLIDIGKQLSSSKQRFGLAHNFGGAAATACVHILENMNATESREQNTVR